MNVIFGGMHDVEQVKEHTEGGLPRLVLRQKLEHLHEGLGS